MWVLFNGCGRMNYFKMFHLSALRKIVCVFLGKNRRKILMDKSIKINYMLSMGFPFDFCYISFNRKFLFIGKITNNNKG